VFELPAYGAGWRVVQGLDAIWRVYLAVFAVNGPEMASIAACFVPFLGRKVSLSKLDGR
jgi:hypothetical protein